MFQLIKFDDKLFGVKVRGVLHLGDKFTIGNMCIDEFNGQAEEVVHALASFQLEGKNFADFGVNGFWTFIENRAVQCLLPAIPLEARA